MTPPPEFTPNPVSEGSQNHRSWGEGCSAWELMNAKNMVVIVETMPPGTSETMHHHDRATQFFYVLDGELSISFEAPSDPSSLAIEAGSGIEIPAGVAHQARNDSASANRFLVLCSSPTGPDRVEH